MQAPTKVLVIRNDKLGDFMLAWPAFALLKKQFPETELTALVPEYTRPMAKLCPWLDQVIIDHHNQSTGDTLALARQLKEQKFDVVIDFHPQLHTALAVFLSRIPHRFAPASRLVQMLYNHRLAQRRSRSVKPEFEYNLELASFMCTIYACPSTAKPASPPYLLVPQKQSAAIRESYYSSQHIDKDKKLVLVHPGSGGSALNLRLQSYAQLIGLLSSDSRLHFVITAGPGEESTAHSLSSLLQNTNHSVYISREGLAKFTTFLSIAEIFISGSTGVLHIAGALDVPTVAFYPSKQSATSLRWRTLNSDGRRLSFTSESDNDAFIIIDMNDCYDHIVNHFLHDNQPGYIINSRNAIK